MRDCIFLRICLFFIAIEYRSLWVDSKKNSSAVLHGNRSDVTLEKPMVNVVKENFIVVNTPLITTKRLLSQGIEILYCSSLSFYDLGANVKEFLGFNNVTDIEVSPVTLFRKGVLRCFLL